MDMIEWLGDAGLSLPGQVVERGVLGGGIEIDPEILNSSDLIPLLPDPDKDVLYYFFRRFAGLDDGERELEKAPVLAAINESECGLVTCRDLLQKLLRIIVRQKGWVIFHMTVVQDSPVSFPATKLFNPFVNQQAKFFMSQKTVILTIVSFCEKKYICDDKTLHYGIGRE